MPDEHKPERRRAPRRALFDTVQWTEVQSGGRTKARISDISVTGCYVDTVSPLPIGTQIRLKLGHRGTELEVLATVVRIEFNMGMGVAFNDLTLEQQAVLDKWINE